MRWGIKEETKRGGKMKEEKSEDIHTLEYEEEEGGLYAVPEASRSDMPRG